ncbi:hypothetical protein [Ilumatobacter sp.]|uniref:hypothetical protein n=1 Tax=Ilumatobacter sp. TaxID=1967498 RepID=UPI003AF9E544
MPDDNAQLASVQVEFPRLEPDSVDGCPVSSDELLRYLADEVPDGESIVADDLIFLRTAQVDQTRYWIWSFNEPDGDRAYATVSAGPAGTTIGYEADYYALSPEQFIVGDYHSVF